jgi:hypothetical protein
LEGIIHCPAFAGDWRRIDQPGYDSGSKLWYHPTPDLAIPAVPASPSDEQLKAAKKLLVDDLFVDFPFEDEASRANALAYAITFFVRRAIQGPIPLADINAPVPGSGKGLLADVLTSLSTGQPCSKTAQPDSEAEWRKAISAALVEGPEVVVFDNLHGVLKSGALEQLLTCEYWSDRILGKTERLRLPNRCIWMITANNLELGSDLLRRVVSIRLNPKMERPYERSPDEFRHPDLLAWLRSNRGECIWAVLVLIQSWIAKGRPRGNYTMGSFQAWVDALGGILDAGGINGFLGNAQKHRFVADDETLDCRTLCRRWWRKHRDQEVGVKTLFEIVGAEDLFPYVLAAPNEGGQRRRLGHLLKRITDRVFEVFRIVEAGSDNSNRRQYKLELLDGQIAPADDDQLVDNGVPQFGPGELDYLFDPDGRPEEVQAAGEPTLEEADDLLA